MIRRTSLIYKELHRLGPLSNQELSELLQLTPGGITQILQPLVAEGILQEITPDQYRAGENPGPRKRRKTTWQPNPDYGIGIVGLVRDEHITFYRVCFHLGLPAEYLGEIILALSTPIVPQIAGAIVRFRKESSTPLRAVGFAVSGRVELSTNRILYSNNLPYLVDLDLAANLEAVLKVPTLVVNDSYALSVGERYIGQAKNLLHFLTLFVDEGVGMGIVIDGKPYQGFENLAGEPGQYVLSPQDGALEAYLSQEALAKQLVALGVPGLESPEGRNRTYEILTCLVADEDFRGLQILEEASDRLGLLITNLILLLSPETVFLTGPLGDLGLPLEVAVRKQIRAYAPSQRADSMTERLVVRGGWRERMVLGTGLAAFEVFLNRRDQLEPNPRTRHTT